MLIDQRQFTNAAPYAIETSGTRPELEVSIAALAATTSAGRAVPGGHQTPSVHFSIAGLLKRLGCKVGRLRRHVRVMSKRRLRRARRAIQARRQREHKRRTLRDFARTPQANHLLALEPRIVFDAAIAATADHVADQVAEQQAAAAAFSLAEFAAGKRESAIDGITSFATAAAEGAHEIVFVDAGTDHSRSHIEAISALAEIVFLDARHDGMAQIAEHLENRSGFAKIHIISHGEADALVFHNSQDDAPALAAPSAALSAIRSALGPGGEFWAHGDGSRAMITAGSDAVSANPSVVSPAGDSPAAVAAGRYREAPIQLDNAALDTDLPDIVEGSDGDSKTAIVFIDSSVTDPAVIAAAVPAGAEVVYLEAGSDGLGQIAAHVDGRTDISALHIVSHGKPGELHLGASVLDEQSIHGAHADELAAISAALSDDADILIYGCSFGDNADAVAALAAATGADVAASDDDTGAAERGGDWELEVVNGVVETAAIQAEDWDGLLAPLTISATAQPTLIQNGTVDLGPNINPLLTGNPLIPAPTYSQALWTNAGTVGGTSIDLRATVISTTHPNDMAILFQTIGDDPTVAILTGPGGAGATAEIRWEVFESGTNQSVAAFGAPTITVSDIDGNGAPNTIETIAPHLDGLLSAEIDGGSELVLSTASGVVTATGTSQDPTNGLTNTRPSAAIKFTWSERSSWTINYTAERAEDGRLYQNDGDGDFVFLPPSLLLA